ncbi:MAG: VOC family protein [bacterium]
MYLNHLNIPVSDVPAAAAFLSSHFAMRSLGQPSPKFALLGDDAGMVLALSNFSGAGTSALPPAFHIGFIMASRSEVDAMHQRLTAAGHASPGPRKFHGSWTFYTPAPGGFTVEVQHWEGSGQDAETSLTEAANLLQ